MRILFLYGIKCTPLIWNPIKDQFCNFEVEFAEYPHEVTKRATCVDDLVDWLCETYDTNQFDCIVGHSMGGILGLKLIAERGFQINHMVLIDTSLKPAEVFYRNLMTCENTEKHPEVMEMMKQENDHYSEVLGKSIQDNFDFTPLIHKTDCLIDVIYGDRGLPDYEHRLEDLNLDNLTMSNLHIHFVANSCHMPMIENPIDFSSLIQKCLNR